MFRRVSVRLKSSACSSRIVPSARRGYAQVPVISSGTGSARSRPTAAAAERKTGSGTEVRWISSSSNVRSPSVKYRELSETGTLRSDPHQESIIDILQDLHDQLAVYEPPTIPSPPSSSSSSSSSSGLLSRWFSSSSSSPTPSPSPSSPTAPKGLYLYGDVGTGKSMLMDLFYDTLPPNITRKRRVHFHAFMIDVHKALHRQAGRGVPVEDAIKPVADELAREVQVLCFDEFQVTDIADAMILRRLLERLVDCGVTMVMTSNRHPDELYKNGIQRDSFLPAIALLKSRLLITSLNSGTDYRRLPRALSKVYFSPLSHSNRTEFQKLFKALSSANPDAQVERNRKLSVWGRDLIVPESGNGVAKFRFDELCGHPLSAADYIEIAKHFGTIFVEDVPSMGMSEKDKARRFITFIDACYEGKTKLFALSEVPIFEVFSGGEKDGKGISDHMRSVMDDLGLSSDIVGASSIFTGEEETFAFARACSRLVQMGSKQWAESDSESAR